MPVWIINIVVIGIAGLFGKKALESAGGLMLIFTIAVAVGSHGSIMGSLIAWLVALFIGWIIVVVKEEISEASAGVKSASSLSPELHELYSRLKRNDGTFNDIVVDDLPVEYLFKHAIEQRQDIFVQSFNKFIAALDEDKGFKLARDTLDKKIQAIFASTSTSSEKLGQVNTAKGQTGAVLQNAVLYAVACAYKNGAGIQLFMRGKHSNESMYDFIAPLEDEEYCAYMLKNQQSLSSVIVALEKQWYQMLVAVGYMIMSNNDDEHHDHYTNRMLDRTSAQG
jgi:hypothetical protein